MGPAAAPMLSDAVANDPDMVGAVTAARIEAAISVLPTAKESAP